MKKFAPLLFIAILAIGILGGYNFKKIDLLLIKKYVKNTESLTKTNLKYNLSFNSKNYNSYIDIIMNVLKDSKDNKSLIKLHMKTNEYTENFSIYSTTENDFLKLCNSDNFINTKKNHDSTELNLVKSTKTLANKTFKNLNKHLLNMIYTKNAHIENNEHTQTVTLTLNSNESKILYDKFLQANTNITKDIILQNLKEHNSNLYKFELDSLKEKLYKEFEDKLNIAINDYIPNKIIIKFNIDKKHKLITSYETNTELISKKENIYIDFNCKLLDYGNNMRFDITNLK